MEDVKITFPFPKSVLTCNLEPSKGKVAYDENTKVFFSLIFLSLTTKSSKNQFIQTDCGLDNWNSPGRRNTNVKWDCESHSWFESS